MFHLQLILQNHLKPLGTKFKLVLFSAALQHIPNKKFTIRNFQHIFSSKASKLHSGLKKLGNIIRQVKAASHNHTPVPIFHNQNIDQLNSLHHLNIPILSQDINLLPD